MGIFVKDYVDENLLAFQAQITQLQGKWDLQAADMNEICKYGRYVYLYGTCKMQRA